MASAGDWNRAGAPPRRTSPSYPPVSQMTGIPKRMFMRVDLPAPFSPTSAWISPSRTESETPFRTRFCSYSLTMPLSSRAGALAVAEVISWRESLCQEALCYKLAPSVTERNEPLLLQLVSKPSQALSDPPDSENLWVPERHII